MDTLTFKFLRDSALSEQMAIDGSVTPVEFEYIAPHDGVSVQRVNFVLADAGIRIYDRFGGDAALTNGIEIKHYAADGLTVLIDFLDGETIKRNSDFAYLAGADIPVPDTSGTDVMAIRWTIAKAGEPLQLKRGESLRITIADDLTSITSFIAMLQGVFT